MILTILVPEYIMGKALQERLAAASVVKLLKEMFPKIELVHAYIMNMGGYYLDFSLETESSPLNFDHLVEETRQYMGLDQQAPRSENLNLDRLRRDKWVLTAWQIWNAKGQGMFRDLPRVSAQELEQLSKGDTIVKLLAILQICWLMLQLLSRAIRNLPSSQFEIAALAFASTSLVTYAILWNRP